MTQDDVDRAEIAVVVGATGAFGTAIVDRLVSEGLRVVAVARSADKLAGLQARQPSIDVCVADIADDGAVDALGAVLDRPVRALVHGPGVGVAGGIQSAPTTTLTEAVNIKVGGLLRLVRAADEQLVGGSRIIAIGGHYGLEPTAYAAAAGIANAALVNAVRQLSLAYGERGVTAHVIAPGPADTERLRRVELDLHAHVLRGGDERRVELAPEHAVGLLEGVDERVAAVAVLREELEAVVVVAGAAEAEDGEHDARAGLVADGALERPVVGLAAVEVAVGR